MPAESALAGREHWTTKPARPRVPGPLKIYQ